MRGKLGQTCERAVITEESHIAISFRALYILLLANFLPIDVKLVHTGVSHARVVETGMRQAPMQNRRVFCVFVLYCSAAFMGCTWSGKSESDKRAREEKTRDEVAKATERAKPILEDAGRKIGKAAAEAADEAQAAAEGVKEGWSRGGHHLVNVNAATESELAELPGISRRDARRIVDARPYQDKHQLVAKGVLSESTYQKIRDRITSK